MCPSPLHIAASLALFAACGSHEPPVGELVGGTDVTDDVTHIHYAGRDVPLAKIPAAQSWGFPVSGTATIAIDVDVPRAQKVDDYARATGRINISCTACQIGDDAATLHTSFGDVEVGHISVQRFLLSIEIANGEAVVTGWTFDSSDVAVALQLQLQLAHRLADSAVDGCLKFRPSDALQKANPKTAAALAATGAELRADGNFHIRLGGKVGTMRRTNEACGDSMP